MYPTFVFEDSGKGNCCHPAPIINQKGNRHPLSSNSGNGQSGFGRLASGERAHLSPSVIVRKRVSPSPRMQTSCLTPQSKDGRCLNL